MSAKRVFFVVTVVLTVAIMMVLAIPALSAVNTGDKAPDFQLKSLDGKSTIKLSDYTTKPTLLVFWVSWCPHCQHEMPILDKIYKNLKDSGVNVVGVSVDEDIHNGKYFVDRYGITFPNAYAGPNDSGKDVTDKYGIMGVPTIYIIGKDGIVKAKYTGEVAESIIINQFDLLGVK